MKKKPGTTANPATSAVAAPAADLVETTALPAPPSAPADTDSEPVSPGLADAMREALIADMTGPEPEAEPEEPEAIAPVEPELPEPETELPDSPEEESDDEEPEAEPEETTAPESKSWPKSYFRRIKRLQEKIEALETRLAEGTAPPTAPEPAPPAPLISDATAELVSDPEENAIHTEVAKRETYIADLGRYLNDLEEGRTPTAPDGRPVPWTREQMQTARARFTDELSDLKAELHLVRAEHRRNRARAATELAQSLTVRHPWIKDKTNRDTQIVNTLLSRYPVLQQIPEARTWLADGLAYQRLLEKARAKAGNGKPAASVPARGPARPASAPRPPPGREAEQNARYKKFLETGSATDGKALLEQLL